MTSEIQKPYEYLTLAREHVVKKTQHTHVLNVEAFDMVPKFHVSGKLRLTSWLGEVRLGSCCFLLTTRSSFSVLELEIGRVLGRGGFGVVSEITTIRLVQGSGSGVVTPQGNSLYENRRSMEASSTCGKSGGCSFVIKRLHEKSLQHPSLYFRAVIDLALEARFLSVLRHPHILTLRGAAATDPYDGNFFLVLERLFNMLTTRLNTWKKHQPSKLMDRNGNKKRYLYITRCQVAHDICCALKYMHSLK